MRTRSRILSSVAINKGADSLAGRQTGRADGRVMGILA
jgi:hypothetical protein